MLMDKLLEYTLIFDWLNMPICKSSTNLLSQLAYHLLNIEEFHLALKEIVISVVENLRAIFITEYQFELFILILKLIDRLSCAL